MCLQNDHGTFLKFLHIQIPLSTVVDIGLPSPDEQLSQYLDVSHRPVIYIILFLSSKV